MREFFDEALFDYCVRYSTQPDPLLRELERETHLRTVNPQMICGPYQGIFLEILSRMIEPQRALEIGTFTGYAAICIARGLPDGGRLDTIEIEPAVQGLAAEFFAKAGLDTSITLHSGNALEIVPLLKGNFDMVFIDAAKRDNARYFDMLTQRLNHGGIILLDNVLWGGKVVSEDDDDETRAIHELNAQIADREDLRATVLPIRDGLTVIQRI